MENTKFDQTVYAAAASDLTTKLAQLRDKTKTFVNGVNNGISEASTLIDTISGIVG